VTATVPYVLAWLAATVAVLAAPLLVVLPVTPLLDRRTTRRRLRASKVARPVTGEHVAAHYMWTRALDRGDVQLAVAHA
jgi:hypothetical protein